MISMCKASGLGAKNMAEILVSSLSAQANNSAS